MKTTNLKEGILYLKLRYENEPSVPLQMALKSLIILVDNFNDDYLKVIVHAGGAFNEVMLDIGRTDGLGGSVMIAYTTSAVRLFRFANSGYILTETHYVEDLPFTNSALISHANWLGN
jgi:hypothetical protein